VALHRFNLPEESDDAKYISEKTLYTMRQIMIENYLTYRWRAGVEATMSEFDKLTGVKKLRVTGRKAVRWVATMKAAGLNLLRAARVMRANPIIWT